MRLPKTAHTSRPWRIHEIAPDFRVEDVWALPTPGGPDDFPQLIELVASNDPLRGSSAAVRTLFAIRWKVGELLGWDGEDSGAGPDLGRALPFRALYLTDDEWAAEIANRTMHGVMHIGWVADGKGGYRGQMAVLVKPNGCLGHAYMAAILPFRHLMVYPRMLDEIGRRWQARAGDRASAPAGAM
jgi:hypothetical protein